MLILVLKIFSRLKIKIRIIKEYQLKQTGKVRGRKDRTWTCTVGVERTPRVWVLLVLLCTWLYRGWYLSACDSIFVIPLQNKVLQLPVMLRLQSFQRMYKALRRTSLHSKKVWWGVLVVNIFHWLKSPKELERSALFAGWLVVGWVTTWVSVAWLLLADCEWVTGWPTASLTG